MDLSERRTCQLAVGVLSISHRGAACPGGRIGHPDSAHAPGLAVRAVDDVLRQLDWLPYQVLLGAVDHYRDRHTNLVRAEQDLDVLRCAWKAFSRRHGHRGA